MIRIIITDLDNTLIETQALFAEGESLLSGYVGGKSGASAQDICNTVRDSQLRVYQALGFGPETLPTAYAETLVHHFPAPSQKDIDDVRAIADMVNKKEATLKPGVGETVPLLARHVEALYLLTQGHPAIQQPRIAALPFIHHFQETWVVPEKNLQLYTALPARLGVDPAEILMIGDSLRYDINPAIQAGLHAWHIPSDNWSVHEQGHTLPVHDRCMTHASFAAAKDHLAALKTAAPVPAPILKPR